MGTWAGDLPCLVFCFLSCEITGWLRLSLRGLTDLNFWCCSIAAHCLHHTFTPSNWCCGVNAGGFLLAEVIFPWLHMPLQRVNWPFTMTHLARVCSLVPSSATAEFWTTCLSLFHVVSSSPQTSNPPLPAWIHSVALSKINNLFEPQL